MFLFVFTQSGTDGPVLVERGICGVQQTAAVELLLEVSACIILKHPPRRAQQRLLLPTVHRQTRARNSKLEKKNNEQDHHVEEEHDLVVVDGSDEAHDGDEQQEEAHRNHSPDDVDTGHQTEAFPPGSHSDQQQPHQHIHHVEGAERIFRAGEAPADHLGAVRSLSRDRFLCKTLKSVTCSLCFSHRADRAVVAGA